MTENERLREVQRALGFSSQAEFAEKLGIKQGSLSDIYRKKNGIGVSDSIKRILENEYSININWLSMGEGKMYKQTKENAAAVVDASVMYVPLVSKYAQAGYLSGFGDDEYLEALPTIPFVVEHEGKGDYLCFEVKGDSMNDGTVDAYVEGEILLCREITQDLWCSRKLHLRNWDFVIVHKEEGVLVKEIIDHNTDHHTITIHSKNNFYEDQVLELKDIQKIFNVVGSQRPRRK